MIQRILVAVDDSPASLAAARASVGLAADLHAKLLALHVLTDGVLIEALTAASGRSDVGARRESAAASVLNHVAAAAHRAGVEAETMYVEGEVARSILREARRWSADLIVIGRTRRPRAGEPVLGSEAQHIVEFADKPVVIVAQASEAG